MANDSGKVLDELHPIKVVSKVGYLVGMDLTDAHRVASTDNRYILTTTDYFTKYVEAVHVLMDARDCHGGRPRFC